MDRYTGRIIELEGGRVFPGTLHVEDGRIRRVVEEPVPEETYLAPGFVDAHVHIESSLLVPSEFARMAVVHGTVATVSDPHEIANVLGVEGVEYMIRSGQTVPLKFFFGAPSCVPATPFETAGAVLDVAAVEALLDRPDILYLSEMMNFPAAIAGDPEVLRKVELALERGKPVDGHAPGLRGEGLRTYAARGISTDHESFALDEALEKIEAGMRIAIREGSAARNFDALAPLLGSHPERCFLCTDDLHADALLSGHINTVARRAIALGHDPLAVLRAASLNPVRHYGLPVGLLREGDPADFIELGDLTELPVVRTVIDGTVVAERGRSLIPRVPVTEPNRFDASPVEPERFRIPAEGRTVQAIRALDRQLITERELVPATTRDGLAVADPARDLLKLTVVNRYRDAAPALAFIRGFGLARGALASSVAHDSHNVVAVGATDDDLARAVNGVIESRGGLAVADGDGGVEMIPLPVAGLMSGEDGFEVARRYMALEEAARGLGSPLSSPFMTLSFMALLVIPALKLSDLGLFDGERFEFTGLFQG
jgi:adenine deaminase